MNTFLTQREIGFTSPKKNLARLGVLHGHVVLDIGAGTGDYTNHLEDNVGYEGRVIAFDSDSEALKELRKKVGERVHLLFGDIEEERGTKLADNSVDTALLSNLFSFIANKERAIREVKRVLKPGGRVLVIDWHDLLPFVEANQVFSQARFNVLDQFDAGNFHWGAIIQKPYE